MSSADYRCGRGRGQRYGRSTPSDAISVVSIVTDGSYSGIEIGDDPAHEVDLIASIDHELAMGKLAGFVVEGLVP